jgi:hypothetical protein
LFTHAQFIPLFIASPTIARFPIFGRSAELPRLGRGQHSFDVHDARRMVDKAQPASVGKLCGDFDKPADIIGNLRDIEPVGAGVKRLDLGVDKLASVDVPHFNFPLCRASANGISDFLASFEFHRADWHYELSMVQAFGSRFIWLMLFSVVSLGAPHAQHPVHVVAVHKTRPRAPTPIQPQAA